MRRLLITTLGLAALALVLSTRAGVAEALTPDVLAPAQITAEAGQLLSFTVSADGATVVYSLGREIGADLWRRSADPVSPALPERLTNDVAEEREPDLSADGKLLTYTGTAHDVKGDIFLLDLGDPKKAPVRLTGRETEDGWPRFSPDGARIYFQTRPTASAPWQLAVVDRASGRVTAIATNGDGASPAVSPDGRTLAFVSRRADPKGADIFTLDLASGRVTQVTSGPAIDLAPQWGPKGRELYFSRISLDTNGDGAITKEDRAAIYHIALDAAKPAIPLPLTPFSYSAHGPVVRGKNLYFLADLGGIDNCWQLPAQGQIPVAADGGAQLAIARRLDQAVPPRPDLATLAYLQVVDAHGNEPTPRARALYRAGCLFKEEGHLAMAGDLFAAVCRPEGGACVEPETSLARIQAIVVAARLKEKNGVARAREEAIRALSPFGANPDHRIAMAAVLEEVRLATADSSEPGRIMAALTQLDQGLAAHPAVRDLDAEATLLKADLFSRFNPPAKTYPLYRKVLRDYADQGEWADLAASRIVDLVLRDAATSDRAMRIATLRRIAEENARELPRIAMTALNRLADTYYHEDETAKAKQVYYQVIDSFPGAHTQTGAARLALAEILYKEQRFREALALYQAEIDTRPPSDSIWMLARQGYIGKSLAEAEYLFRLGEVTAAKKIFQTLIAFDPAIVEAHRGLIKSAAALGSIEATIGHYREEARRRPGDPIPVYASALALTYRNTEASAREAEGLLRRAIGLKGDCEYFHQTAGYVYEVLETVYGEPGMLEHALTEYRKAYFLNRRGNDRANTANLLLNLGNVNYLLGRYEQALRYFDRRAAAGEPFADPNAEILFYRRLGHAAYQSRQSDQAIKAFAETASRIDQAMDPLRSVATFDRLDRFITGRLLTPARALLRDAPNRQPMLEKVNALAEEEARLKEAVAKAAEGAPTPESGAWPAFTARLKALYLRQATWQGRFVALSKELRGEPQSSMLPTPEETAGTLKIYASRLDQDLGFPQRLLELKAEIADRLGLALQDTGRWQEAAQSFAKAFSLNQALGHTANLAVKKRAEAYCLYMAAGQVRGDRRQALLDQARAGFEEALDLLGRYGVAAAPAKKPEEGLINVSLNVALDKSDVSTAAYGFSAVQEARLAQAFLMRIDLEQGRIEAAWRAVQPQLAQYPVDKEVATRDRFGVSLLCHRAGQLAVARGDWPGAFDLFARSANLCLELGTPTSLLVNLRNLAAVLGRITPLPPERLAQLLGLDREASALLAAKSGTLPPRTLATLQNDLGCGYLRLAAALGAGLDDQVRAMALRRRAMAHFTRGLALLDGRKDAGTDRERLTLLATLHYNLGRLSQQLGEEKEAAPQLEKAAQLAEQGLLGDISWRALAALGRYDEALDQLRELPFPRAHAEPGEVVTAFMPRLQALVAANQAEAGFNLLAELAEIERYQRLAPLVFDLGRQEEAAILAILPRLRAIAALETQLASAPSTDQPAIRERLAQERAILNQQQPDLAPLLPPLLKGHLGTTPPALLLRLMGTALESEQLAATVARSPEPAAKPLADKYFRLLDQYRQLIARLGASADGRRLAAFFAPQPDEAMDAMDALAAMGHGERLLRLVAADERGKYLAFTVAPDTVTVKEVTSAAAARPEGTKPLVLVADDPGLIQQIPAESFAFSTGQFLRSLINRKPFKKRLLVLGGDAPATELAPPAADLDTVFVSLTAPPAGGAPLANLLLLADDLAPLYQVPARDGVSGGFAPGIRTPAGRFLPLDAALAAAGNLTVAILPRAAAADAYPAANLLTLCGVPTILLPRTANAAPAMVPAILGSIRAESPAAALATAAPAHDPQRQWLVIGYRGMDASEAGVLARKQFAGFVRAGRALFDAKQPAKALAPFANAIDFAEQAPEFKQYLPQLYNYARECAFLSGDLATAVRYADKAVEYLARTAPDSDKHAEALLRLGLLESSGESFDRATAHLEEALDIYTNLESPEAELQAMDALGVVLENATAYDRALQLFGDAAALAKRLDKGLFMAQQEENIGRVYDLRLNNFAKATEFYSKAAALFAKAGDAAAEARAQLDIGRCARLLGNFPEAEARYAKALALARAASLAPAEGATLVGEILLEQANNAWYQARYDTALRLANQTLDLAARHHLNHLATMARNTAGLIWWTLGRSDKGLVELNRALVLAKGLANREDEVSTTLNNLALVYREAGRFDQALAHIEAALAVDRRLGSKWALAYDLKNKGRILLDQGKPADAIPLFRQAAEDARSIGNRINEAKCALWLATALERNGQAGEAGRAFAEARALAGSMALKEVEWRAIFGQARQQLSQKNPDAAKALLFACLERIEAMRADIKIEQLRDSFITNKLDVYETLVTLLADQGEIEQAFAVAERSRARNFIDLLGNQRLTLDNPADQALYDRWQGLKARVAEYEKLLAQAASEPTRKTYGEALTQLRHDLDSAMVAIQLANPQLGSLVSVETIALPRLQALLDPGTAFISYYFAKNELFCWVIDKGGVKFKRLPLSREVLGDFILDYRRRTQNLEPVVEMSTKLYQWLVAPIAADLAGKARLCFIPHGPLHYLSFATLFDGSDYLIDRYPLFYLPSASVYEHTVARRRPVADKTRLKVLAVGNPDLGDPLLALPFAEQEVDTIHWNFPDVTVLTGKRATKQWLVANIGRFNVIHLATHGEFDPVTPLASALKLASQQEGGGDLKADEILGLTINADLVVLSACQTGLGKVTSGDDVIGLNRAFFYAGTHALISSLWRVSDIATAVEVKHFYRMYPDNTKAQSLRKAMLHVKSRFPHPGYWGAFTLVGDYQ